MNRNLQHDDDGIRRLPDSQLNQLLRQQEIAWRTGTSANVETLLQEAGVASCEKFDVDQLLTLICGEVLLRESLMQRPSLAEYQLRFPNCAVELGIQWEIDHLLGYQSLETTQIGVRDVDNQGNEANSQTLPNSIGPYEIFSELGRGSMGIVYEAWDPQLKRRLAVKRLRAGIDSGLEDMRRMRTEAEVIAKIRHTNIVQIFEVGETDGSPYLAMEFCEGGSLASRLTGNPLTPKLAAEVVKQISLGVAAAHRSRIIHRDLKPGNILLVTADGWTPQVNDFGLAKNLDNEISATTTGSILGTPAYMSPEQATGDLRLIGAASDIYSIGAILYECLTGSPPFRGVGVAETLDQVRRREPVKVRQLQPKVPIDLETITHKCLRKEISQRYGSAQALADDLQRFLDQRPVLARRESWIEATRRTARKYPLASTLATLSVLLLLTIAIGSTVFASRLRLALEESRQHARTAQLEQANALIGRAHGIRSSHQPGQRLDAIAAILQANEIGKSLGQPPEWFEPIRDEAIAALMLPDACVTEWREEAEIVQTSDFSDDHRFYAISFPNGNISVRRMQDHLEVANLPRLDETVGLLFVATDQLMQFGDQTGKFEKWNLGVSPPQRVWQHDSGYQKMALAPDHQMIAVVDSRGIQIVRLSDGEVIHRLDPKPFYRDAMLTMHPTHPYLCLYSYVEPAIEIRNWQSGEILTHYKPSDNIDNNFSGADWSPDGKRFVLLSGHGRVLRWFEFDPDSAALRLEKTQSPSGFSQGGLSFNVRGDRIWHNGWAQQVEIFDAIQGTKVFASFNSDDTFLAGFPKRDPLGNCAGLFRVPDRPERIGFMRIADRSESNLLVPLSNGEAAVAFDPAERFVVIRKSDGLKIVCPFSRRVLLDLKIADLNIHSFSFAGEHQLIVNAYEGCFRWPYDFDAANNRIEFGVPQRILIPSGNGSVTASRDGQTVACGVWNGYGTQEYAGVWIKAHDEPAARKIVGQLSGSVSCVSPDGRWAVGTHSGTSVFDGEQPSVVIYHLNSVGKSTFNNEGSRLLAGGKLINTANWEIVPRLEEGFAHQLTPDGKFVLSYLQSHVDVLSEATTGRVFARIPGGSPGTSVLSPNGDLLIRQTGDGYYITDLRAVANGVTELGLPWDGPDYDQLDQPTPLDSIGIVPALLDVDSTEKLFQLMDTAALKRFAQSPDEGQAAFDAGMVRIGLRDLETAVENLNRACELLPQSVAAKQWRAYVLAELKRWPEAIADADWVLQQIDEPDFRLLRAEWLIRNGEFQRAIEDCSLLIDGTSSLAARSRGLRGYCLGRLNDETAAQLDAQCFAERMGQDDFTLNLVADPMVGADLSLRHPLLAQLVIDRLRDGQTDFDPEIQTTIALALYRNDRFDESLSVIVDNLTDKSKAAYAYGQCIAAMCKAQLGDHPAARRSLQQVQSWTGKFEDYREQHDLKLLQAEAVRLINDAKPIQETDSANNGESAPRIESRCP